LREIADADGIEVAEEALELIVRLSRGGVRDAQSTLDQMAAFCAGKIEAADILLAHGLVSTGTLDELIREMRSGNYGKILSLAGNIANSNCDLYGVLCDLEFRLHEQLSGLLSTNEGNFPEREIRILEAISRSKDAVKFGFDERVNFEAALLHAAEQAQSRAIDFIVQTLREKSAQPAGGQENATTSRLPQSTQNLLRENFHAKIRMLKSE
jgi:DNA polymerase III gamma/tau subunit